MVTPGDATRSDVDALATWCRGCREWIRATVLSRGGLVLRGWRLRGVADAERLIFEAMGFPTAEPFPQVFLDFNARAARLGVPPGGITQSNLSRDAPRAQPRQQVAEVGAVAIDEDGTVRRGAQLEAARE